MENITFTPAGMMFDSCDFCKPEDTTCEYCEKGEKKMEDLYRGKDLEEIGEKDITGKWVVIAPKHLELNYSKDYQNLENQIVKAVAGFGCKGAKLSSGGGKVFIKHIDGCEGYFYRNELLGLASDELLKRFDLQND